MSISEKEIKEYEEKYRKTLYEKFNIVISAQAENVPRIKSICKSLNIDINDLPNIGITINNKVTEMNNIFKQSGVSLFANYNEKYDFVSTNFVGDAILSDLLSNVVKSVGVLESFTSTIEEIDRKRTEQVKALTELGPIKKFFLRIRSLFVPNTVTELTSPPQEDIEKAKSYLSEYMGIDEKIWDYNLKDNLVQSIVTSIRDQHLSLNIPELLNEYIEPTLKKLGLEELIPQLQEELSKSQDAKVTETMKQSEIETKTSIKQNAEGKNAIQSQNLGNTDIDEDR